MPHILSRRSVSVLFGSSILALALLNPRAEAGSVTIKTSGSVTVGAGDEEEASSSLPSFFHYDFSKVQEGSLPKGWISEKALVKQGKERRYLTTAPGLSERTKVTVQSGTLSFPEDWRFEWTQNQVSGCDTKLTLGELSVFIGMCWENKTKTVYKLNDQQKIVSGSRIGQRLDYAVEKKGDAVRLLVEGDEILLGRMTDLHPTSFLFTFEAEARVLDIKGVNLSKPEAEPADGGTAVPMETMPAPAQSAGSLDEEIRVAEAFLDAGHQSKTIRSTTYRFDTSSSRWVATQGPGDPETLIVREDPASGHVNAIRWVFISESGEEGDSGWSEDFLYSADGNRVLQIVRTDMTPEFWSTVVVKLPAGGPPICERRRTGDPAEPVPCAELSPWSREPSGNGNLPNVTSVPTFTQVFGR